MKPKSILIVAPYGFNDRMTSFIEFATGRLLARSNWNVTALVRSDANVSARENVSNISVYRYASVQEGIRIALGLLFRQRPDIIHIHNLRNNRTGIFVAMSAAFLRIPLAFTEYGLFHDHYLVSDRDDPFSVTPKYKNVIRTFGELLARSLVRPWKTVFFIQSYFFHWPLMHADAVIFVSHHNLSIAKELGIKKYAYLPHISDAFRFDDAVTPTEGTALSPHEKEVEQLLSPVPDRSCGIFIGQMKPRKGWDILLRAIPDIAPVVIDKFIIITSSGNVEKKYFTDLVNELGIRDRLLFLGSVPSNTQLKEAYLKSAVVVVPSRYEGFGLVPLEAFEMGLPVVAARVEALTDFLTDGENAALFSSKEPAALAAAITKVATNSAYRHRIVAGGTATIEKLRGPEYAKLWLEFYDALANRSV
jgi:glycosyltransferase involved in cell wall biosynthesis